ncbi:hypothetical protein BT69DRAFT_1283572 [Atractiella rhizophila]|nr:hypothetical protein BT69DRAFT_1283572 [Atractiella rhizophila]
MFSFPSLLSTHLQRRFLSFLLKRALGKLVKGGEIEMDKVEADLGKGRVAVRDLEIEVGGELFTKHLPPSFPFRLISGRIGLICLTIQWTLFSSSSTPTTPLTFEVSDVSLVFETRSPSSSSLPLSTLDVEETLNSTLNSVTEEFVRRELNREEEEELRREVRKSKSIASIRSLANSEQMDVPGAFGGSPYEYVPPELPDDEDAAEITLLSSAIDRLLKNLKVRIERVNVRIQEGAAGGGNDDDPFRNPDLDKSEVGIQMELRVKEIGYEVETPALLEVPTGSEEPPKPVFPLRTLRISPPELHLLRPAQQQKESSPSVAEPEDNDNASSSSEGSSEGSEIEMMSSGIADLRESQASRLSHRTSYQSFYSFHDASSRFMDTEESDHAGTDGTEEDEGTWELLCSFGTEDIMIRMDSKTGDINVQMGTFQLLATPDQLAILQEFLDKLPADNAQDYDLDDTTQLDPKTQRRGKRATNLTVLCKAVNVVVINQRMFSMDPSWTDVKERFWSSAPHSGTLADVPHFRLRADRLDCEVTKHPDGDVEASFRVTDFSVSEGISTPSGYRTIPVVIFDPNLAQQYDFTPKAPFPSYPSADFLLLPPSKYKPHGKPRLRRSVPVVPSHAVSLRRMHNGRLSLDLAPVRLFVDLSLLERLTPLLEVLRRRRKRERDGSETASEGARTPKGATDWERRHSEGETVLEDLKKSWRRETQPISEPEVSLKVTFIRIDLRCPATFPRRESSDTWPPPLRSGIVTLDVHGFQVLMRNDENALEGPDRRFDAFWENAFLFYLPASGNLSGSLLALSSLSGDVGSSTVNAQSSRLPTVSFVPSSSGEEPSTIVVNIPFIQANISKPTLDGLILLADDLALWAARTFDDSPSSTEVLGSRFFTAKSFVRRPPDLRNVSEASSEVLSQGAKKKMQIKVNLTEVIAQLQIPKQGLEPQTRSLRAGLSDAEVVLETGRDGKDQMFIKFETMDMFLSDVTLPEETRVIVKRTFPQSLMHGHRPAVLVKVLSTTESGTRLKESRISAQFAKLTYFFTPDLQWIEDVSAYGKSPEGAFENAVPNELTKIRLRLIDVSLHLTPPSSSSRLVATVEDLELSTNLMPDVPRTHAKVSIQELHALLIDSVQPEIPSHREAGLERPTDYWKIAGYAEVISLERATILLGLGNGLVLPDLEVLIEDTSCIVSVCADSLITVGEFFGDLSKFGSERTANHINRRRSRKMKASTDLLANIEKKAFVNAPLFDDEPDFLPDNIPSNLEYLLNARRQRRADQTPSEILGSSIHPQETVISNIEGETIKMLDAGGINLIEDYFRTPKHIDTDGDDGPLASSIRCTINNLDFRFHLYRGFDWVITRKRLEEQAKVVRRRLMKIRQLLANGQTLDESLQQGGGSVLDSDELGLPADARNMSANDLITHIDEELRDDISETSSQHSMTSSTASSGWETNFSGPKPPPKRVSFPRSLKQSARPRSKKNSLEFNLLNVALRFEGFPDPSPTKSKIRLEVDNFNIVDNIKTSTWHKFLTELRTSDGGVVRATGSPMVRMEMKTVRPSTSGEEVVLRVKIFPIRLHVDQDALDFMKAFFAFQVPGSPPPSPALTAKEEGGQAFLQRVEIWPVKIKMDYKPKRVDYSALRQGKTIELMNFFHFEGSEMTLRHITVNGISGWSKMGDLLQDVWTRDVKANQLSDVISGIAPIRSVVNIGTGVADLVLLPIEQYKKDGRLIRGLQKGAASFAKTTALETIKLGARLATGTQVILEQAEAVLGAKFLSNLTAETIADTALDMGGGDTDESDNEFEAVSRYATQPADIIEGLQSAYKSFGGNLREAAQTILAVPMEVYERSSSDGRARAVVRAVPIAVIRPMIGATEAVSKTLLGLRNTLDPEAQDEDADKYKRRT